MKKTKLILSALAVFAIVGSALAFKTAYFTPTALYIQDVNGNCQAPVVGQVSHTGITIKADPTPHNGACTNNVIVASTQN